MSPEPLDPNASTLRPPPPRRGGAPPRLARLATAATAFLLVSGSLAGAAPPSGTPRRIGPAVALPGAPFIAVQASPPAVLPSLVLPPAASTDPPLFAFLMRTGDVAMVRGDISRARTQYERAAAVHPGSSAALVAAGKTYDPNVLSLLNVDSAGLADADKAKDWYERARSLGDPAAASLLAALR